MAAGIATLRQCQRPGFYQDLEAKASRLAAGLQQAADSAGVPIALNRVGSMLTPFLIARKGTPVRNFDEATSSDIKRYATFFHAMLQEGVYLPPSQYEAWFVGAAHDDVAIDQTIAAASKAFARL
jgi:glutamate-1-semialdehyde 2,1-aminomutase